MSEFSKVKNFLSGGNDTHFYVLIVSAIVMLFSPTGGGPEWVQSSRFVAAIVYSSFYVSRFIRKKILFLDILKLSANVGIVILIGLAEVSTYFFAAVLMIFTYSVDRWLINTMKIGFRFFLDFAAILVSIFFVVYAKIQTDLAREAQMKNEKLAEELIQFQDRALQAQAELMLCKNSLEICQD